MTSSRARRIILTSLIATAAIAAIDDVRGGDLPDMNIVLGAFVAAVMLSALAGPMPDVAAGLALITVIAGAIIAGPDAFRLPSI